LGNLYYMNAITPTDSASIAFVLRGEGVLLPDLINASLDNEQQYPKLKPENKKLVRQLVQNQWSWATAHKIRLSPAAMAIRFEEGEYGPPDLRMRRDRNASLTHEFGINYLDTWIYDNRDKVVKRVAQWRASVLNVDVLEEEMRNKLDSEFTQGRMNIKAALEFLHDVPENWYDPWDSPLKYIRKTVDSLFTLAGLPLDDVLRGEIEPRLINLTKRAYDLDETGYAYMDRATADAITAEVKMYDILQNNSTLLDSGKTRAKIEGKLAERQHFVELVQKKFGGQSVALDYGCIYIMDQINLIRQFITTDLNDPLACAELEEKLEYLEEEYALSDVIPDIHPMLVIVNRIRDSMARKTHELALDPGEVQSPLPGFDPLTLEQSRPSPEPAFPAPR
jgi:hypothetical protein